jgi:1-deoxy-D-xylulose-5-phosphate synthase
MHEGDQWHAIGKFNPETGLPFEVSGRIWTDAFTDEMVAIGREREDVVALTAAMLIPVGLDGFAAAYPDRVFDVGIAEQHAVTMASGLAYAGLHPVVAVYATFLNRAFDQLLMDCALHKAGVTFVLDRAGITGSDGASHNGMWDMTLASIVPGLRLAAPRDGDQVKTQLREALDVDDAPTVIRFPKGDVGPAVPAVRRQGSVDVLHETSAESCDLLIVGVGAFASLGVEVAEKLEAQGHCVTAVDPRWVLPVSDDLVELARTAGAVAVVEDNLVSGGVGAAVTLAMREAGLTTAVHLYGIPKRFLDHASRGQVLEGLGLTADAVATSLASRLR